MEDEVFSDDEIAAYMNENYINIKGTAKSARMLTRSIWTRCSRCGGAVGGQCRSLSPSLKPFFGGTYFPKAHFLGLMKRSNKRFQETRSEVEAQGEVVFEEISEVVEGYPEMGFDARILKSTVRRALEVLDPKWGGTATDQKFPTPVRWRYLVSAYRKWGDAEVKMPWSSRSIIWPLGASMIMSAEGFIAMRSIKPGSSRTLRRCSTTMHRWRACFFRGGQRVIEPKLYGDWIRHPRLHAQEALRQRGRLLRQL